MPAPTPHDRTTSEGRHSGAGTPQDARTYRLVDFGHGRKLEAIGDYLLDRPCPAADGVRPAGADRWSDADAAFYPPGEAPRSAAGRREGWHFRRPWPADAVVDCGSFSMPVRPTPFGHIGLFPEQAANWQWIAQTLTRYRATKVLNLFAYTGASTLAAAAAGAQVSHVDAAKPNVEAARQAATISGLGNATIRYLVDDARKFTARELRRENRYDLVVLDPPTYGHGHRGQAWRLERDLWPLLEQCLQLVPRQRGALLVTGHSAGLGPSELRDWLGRFRFSGLRVKAGRSGLQDPRGRFLDAGFYLRAVWGEA